MAEPAGMLIPVDFTEPDAARRLTEAERIELLDPVHWDSVLEQYAASMNVAVVLTDVQGRWIGPAHCLKPVWRLLRQAKPTLNGERAFSLDPAAPAPALVAALETGRCAAGHDAAGQAHVIAPLLINGERLGAIIAGQVFDRFPEQLALERVARTFGVPAVQLWETARLQKPIAAATLQTFGELLQSLGRAFLDARYGVIQERERAAAMVEMNRDLAERRRMEERLRESESNLRLALKASGAATWRWQPKGETLEWTSDYRELYGEFPHDPPTFDDWRERIHPDDLGPLLTRIQQALQSRSILAWREEYRILHPHSGIRWMAAFGRVMRDASGQAVLITGINFDITNRKLDEQAVQRRGERLELLSNTLAQLLNAREPATIAPMLFQQVARHLGAETYFDFTIRPDGPGPAVSSPTARSPRDLPEVARREFDRLMSDSVAHTREPVYMTDMQVAEFVQAEGVKKLGIQCYYCSPLLAGDRFLGTLAFASRERATFDDEDLRFVQIIVQYTAVALDRWQNTNQLRHAHELLADRAKHLESLVQQRTANLRNTVSELEAFSYTVAHDLRAPLRAMSGFADVVLGSTELSAENVGFLERIKRSASRLDRLTHDVLSYSQLSRAEISLSFLSLDKLVRDLIETYPNLRAHKLHITVQSPLLEVEGQESLVTQVLSNLLGNACKFVAPGQTPQVTVRTEAFGERVRITVADRGIGIAPEHRARLFKIFGRIHPDHLFEGTGIGLSIVKRAAEKMGGDSGVESSPGKGSEFWVELKRAPVVGGDSEP